MSYTEVRRRKHKKKHDSSKTVENQLKKLQDLQYELHDTAFYKECIERLRCFLKDRRHLQQVDRCEVDVVCYGLGRIAESYIARYQLAFLMALREDLAVPASRCEVYDPQFSEAESSLLKELDFSVLEVNEEGKRLCQTDRVTVFYMPHCGKALYNNLLWRNWGPQLNIIVILGNSFNHMMDSTPQRVLERTANYVIKIHPYTKETPLQVPPVYDDVFNDTSIHTFLQNCTNTVLEGLWEDTSEPVYSPDEAEIIFR